MFKMCETNEKGEKLKKLAMTTTMFYKIVQKL